MANLKPIIKAYASISIGALMFAECVTVSTAKRVLNPKFHSYQLT